ncbi:MAG: PfkB family carbohydrate kinase [Thermodesulfobacteriota bacterium]|nr:PfkB family carbohydrate kinase [Thermodesulfobacteriota bacterium]
MSILVVGSVALDSVETPFGKAERVLGGSAVYFSICANFFSKVNLVAVVGEDFPPEYFEFIKNKGIDLLGLQKQKGNTFFWRGKYSKNLNEAITLETKLNVFENFNPEIPEEYKDCEYVFLANIDPELQLKVLKQVRSPKLVAGDTMNFWIQNKPDKLKETIEYLDLLIINEDEAKELTEETNIITAGKKILTLGPKKLVIKQGSYGSLMLTDSQIFHARAYPQEKVYDPTGAGDSFAGGLLGYLAGVGNTDEKYMRQGIILGSIMASFKIEDFSVTRLKNLTYPEIASRFTEFKKINYFEDVDFNSF